MNSNNWANIASCIKELSDADFYSVFSELGQLYGFDMDSNNSIMEFSEWLEDALIEIKEKWRF